MVLLGTPCFGSGVIPPASIKDYVHTLWMQRDGAPADVHAIAQTADGWLWLGTSTGLYRFDGVSFERRLLFPASSSASQAVGLLDATRSGNLWVALATGDAVELPRGDQDHPYHAPGLPADIPIDALCEDADRHVWALAGDELYRFDGARWQHVSRTAAGLHDAPLDDLLVDTQGTLWIPSNETLFRLHKGQTRFEKIGTPFPRGKKIDIWTSNDGSFWLHKDRVFTHLDIPGGPAPGNLSHLDLPQNSSARILDRQGNMWRIDCGEALVCRYADATQAQKPLTYDDFFADKLTLRDNILSGLSMTVMVDHNNDVWVGTKLGLDRFRAPIATVEHFPQALIYFALVPGQNGALWVGTASEGYKDRWWRIAGATPPQPWGEFKADATVAYRDTDGSILIGGTAGLWRFRNGAFEPIAIPPAMQGKKIQSIARDGEGRLWIGFRSEPVYQLADHGWLRKGDIHELPDAPPLFAVRDKDGSLWFGYAQNRVSHLRGTHVSTYSSRDGLQTGTVTAIWPGDPMLVGGERGLAAFDGKRFHMLQLNAPDVLSGVTGLVLAKDGHYWLNTQAGAVRIAAQDLLHAASEPAFKMPFRLIDTMNGLPGGSQQVRPLPTLVEGTDGRLWFAQADGLAWIDPLQLDDKPAMPQAVIRGLVVKNQSVPLSSHIHLPAGTQAFRVLYTALNAPMPKRVEFRYRLKELGADWQLAETDRIANFTNLRPGDYHFEVEAAAGGGQWMTPAASLHLVIAPTFFQTVWFNLLCIALLLAAIAFMVRRHIYLSNERLRARLQARHAERERIARELHDTLLQGIQGLILRIHAATSKMTKDDPVARSIAHALDRAEEMLVEGRNRVRDLRLDAQLTQEFVARFTELGRQYAVDYPATFRIIANEQRREINPMVCEEIYLIAREALLNAFRHAQATEIEAEVSYSSKHLRICVRDNGIGIGIESDGHGVIRKEGHWGMAGMQERAANMGADLVIGSRSGTGTEVILTVPANAAYLKKKRVAAWWPFQWNAD